MKKSLHNSSFSAAVFCLLFCVSVFSQEAQKIDEFAGVTCDDYLARMDNAIAYAQDNPGSTIYVLIYEGKINFYDKRKNKVRTIFPTFGATRAKILTMKRYLMEIKRFPVERFSFLDAGFRENPLVELWFVPSGAIPPKPSPTVKRMKYWKGKAKGFCVGFP